MVQMLFESTGCILRASLSRWFHDAARTLLQARPRTGRRATARTLDLELCRPTRIGNTCRAWEQSSRADIAIESYLVHSRK